MYFGIILIMSEDIRKQLYIFERNFCSSAHTSYIPERYVSVCHAL